MDETIISNSCHKSLMVKVVRLKFFSRRSIGVVLSCLFAFLFQTSNAAMSYHFTPVETVINGNISEAKKVINKNHIPPTNSKSYDSTASNPRKYNSIFFAICKNCYWCASCMTDETKFDWCPLCRETRVRSIPISTGGYL
jgi:hypothetical protein